MVNDVTVNAPPFALKLMRLYGSSGKTRLVMTNSPFPSKASMLQLSTNKRKVYSLSGGDRGRGSRGECLAKIRSPAVTAIHRERIIQKIIMHLHFLTFRVKQLETA